MSLSNLIPDRNDLYEVNDSQRKGSASEASSASNTSVRDKPDRQMGSTVYYYTYYTSTIKHFQLESDENGTPRAAEPVSLGPSSRL